MLQPSASDTDTFLIHRAATCQRVATVETVTTDDDRIRAILDAKAEEETAAERYDSAIREAKESGITWASMADATGLSASSLRWRAYRHDEEKWPHLAKRTLDDEEREKRRRTNTAGPGAADGPGLSFVDAAKKLGVTRVTVYRWADAGKLKLIELDEEGNTKPGKPDLSIPRNERGRILVAIDEAGNPVKN